MESLYLLILLFFIIIILVPISIRARVFYSVKSNKGAFAISLWFIKIKVAKIKIKDKKIFIQTQNKKESKEIEMTDKQLKFLKIFTEEIKNKTKIKYIKTYSKIGLNSPNYSAIFSTIITSIILAFFAKIKLKRNSAKLTLKNDTSFTENNLIIAINSNFSLSILDIVYSFIVSILKTKQDKKFILQN